MVLGHSLIPSLSNLSFSSNISSKPRAVCISRPRLFSDISPVRKRLFPSLILASSIPMAASSIPMDATSSPMAATSVPMDAASVPMDAASVPMDATSASMAATLVPMDATSVPMDASSVPMDAASVPMDATSVPMDASSVPMDATSVPMAATSISSVPEGMSLKRYVKLRLPGGFAAQKLIGTGRRKCAIARVVIQEGTGKYIINYRDALDCVGALDETKKVKAFVNQEYLQGHPLWLQYIKTPLATLKYETKYDVFVKAHGGGLAGQAQAISLGISRAMLKVCESHRPPLRKAGLLTRDPRVVERKKAGLKKARKAPQYSKR